MSIRNSIAFISMFALSAPLLAESKFFQPIRQYHQAYFDSAEVIDVRPAYRSVRINHPQRQCWDEPVRYFSVQDHSSLTAKTIVGGLIGGIVGHQFGKGQGNDAATAIGTLIGAKMGQDSGHAYRVEPNQIGYEQHCEYQHNVSYEQQQEGYNVTYRYQDELYRIQMPYHPGERIELKVRLTPVI